MKKIAVVAALALAPGGTNSPGQDAPERFMNPPRPMTPAPAAPVMSGQTLYCGAAGMPGCQNPAQAVPERTQEAADLLPLPLALRLRPDLGVVNPRGYDSPDLKGGAWPASATSSPS
jgi:hypothetical protein